MVHAGTASNTHISVAKIKIEITVDSIPEDTELVVKQVMDEKELKNIKKMLEEKIKTEQEIKLKS